MIDKIKKYFDIEELVCPHVYERFGESAWSFIDSRLLEVLLFIREGINKPIYVNNWKDKGGQSQRGLRCNCCALVKEKASLEKVYLSSHIFGKGIDFNIKGMTAEQVRKWIVEYKTELPYKVRIEKDVNWVHIDIMPYGMGNDKITFFK